MWLLSSERERIWEAEQTNFHPPHSWSLQSIFYCTSLSVSLIPLLISVFAMSCSILAHRIFFFFLYQAPVIRGRRAGRRRKSGSCVFTFDLSTVACTHLVQFRMPFVWSSWRQTSLWFHLGSGGPNALNHSRSLQGYTVCVLKRVVMSAVRYVQIAGNKIKDSLSVVSEAAGV